MFTVPSLSNLKSQINGGGGSGKGKGFMGIAASMEKKGYTALMADGYAGIGFRGSLNKTSRRFSEPVWFDIGRKIKDKDNNEHSMTVAAHDSAQYEEYLKKGWKPVEAEKKEEEKEMKKRGKK